MALVTGFTGLNNFFCLDSDWKWLCVTGDGVSVMRDAFWKMRTPAKGLV